MSGIYFKKLLISRSSGILSVRVIFLLGKENKPQNHLCWSCTSSPFFMLSSLLFFLIPHSWKTGRFTHCHPARAATSCSFVSAMNWRRDLFSARLQGSRAVKQWPGHNAAQPMSKCMEEPHHHTACESCLLFAYLLLAALLYDYLGNSSKPLSACCQQAAFQT